ncbi:putative multiple sugar transport system ATP-binding protein [Sporobacter termitidis DSM 10068]|uniref:Putative multiple sugar transport system ATP-binding protein n=1 Tax=Sporobacter termitidis DSM 10068 TaxID=1123282 RepID=A0A1M5ZFI9_9FIRM|nr:sugar ABC transporter ATP-binding protein [Sporobacter termitidis]SHI22997.1 putative multiple sugar transport system ATP-binding protein [Sporobacter termitidis DSM 10068]
MADHILVMKDITKDYPGVRALDSVSLTIEQGEIHALVGENGAGKSTLMSVLSGTISHGSFEGGVIFDDHECRFRNVRDGEKYGIVIIHQELALIPELSIGENMFLGNERRGRLGIDWDETYSQAAKHMKQVGLNERPSALIKDVGTGKQQLVEIAKALSKNVKLLILDEPTSSLNEEEARMLLDMLKDFKNQGMTSIISSHKLSEVAYVADRITIMRDGAVIETIDNKDRNIDEDRIIRGMVGREMTDRYPKREHNISPEIGLEVNDWSVYHPVYTDKRVVNHVSFNVHKGEIVGFSGLQGAGRTELAMSIFGRSYGTSITGTLKVGGKEVRLKGEREAIEAGVAYLTEDRKENGLILIDTVARNNTLARLEKVCSHGIIDVNKENRVAEEYREKLHVKTPTIHQQVSNLSGGNQQKVLLTKWMFADADVLIMDEPTRGIDVGAKYEIYSIMNDLVAQGKSVVMISSEMPELLGMCDRIYVMNEGELVAEFSAAEATQEKIMAAILGSDKKKSKDAGRGASIE